MSAWSVQAAVTLRYYHPLHSKAHWGVRWYNMCYRHTVSQSTVSSPSGPKPSAQTLLSVSRPTSFHAGPARLAMQQLDEQILEVVAGESLSAPQQADLLAWTHRHLLAAYVAEQLDARPDPALPPAWRRLIHPCHTDVDMIGEMLQGGVPLEPDLTFHCPPTGCPGAQALSEKLPGWLRRRVALAAQRTRLHTEAELAELWENIEAHLVAGAMVWFKLADLLYPPTSLPAKKTVHATTRACLDAVRAARGISWDPTGTTLLSTPKPL